MSAWELRIVFLSLMDTLNRFILKIRHIGNITSSRWQAYVLTFDELSFGAIIMSMGLLIWLYHTRKHRHWQMKSVGVILSWFTYSHCIRNAKDQQMFKFEPASHKICRKIPHFVPSYVFMTFWRFRH